MPDDDASVVIATHLRPHEAGMLRGVLESAGIIAVVRDDMLSSVNPLLDPVIGGAKLAVRAADEQRAREIIEAAGVLPGTPKEPVEIPEEEWSRPDGEQPEAPSGPTAWRRLGVVGTTILLALYLLLRCVAGK
jgi:hypothetical protein